MLQALQAGEGSFGHRLDLVPKQSPAEEIKTSTISETESGSGRLVI